MELGDTTSEMEAEIRNFNIRFIEFPDFDGNRLRSFVKTENGEKFQLIYYIKRKDEKEQLQNDLQPGIICSVEGQLKIPMAPTNPNAFNYRTHLRTQGVAYILSVEKFNACSYGKKTLLDRLRMIREQGMQRIEEAFPEEAAPFINALLFGESGDIERTIMEDYQKLGISHLLAISGTHITILTIFLYVSLVRLGLTKETASVTLLIFLPIYCILAGASPSVNRAVVMAWMVLFFSRQRFFLQPLDALGITYTIFMLINPYNIYHVGFQLSYLVTAGIILSRKLLQKWQHPLLQTAMVSAIAQWVSIPILLYHFYEFSLISFFVNILYVPLYSLLILPLSFIVFILLVVIPKLTAPLVAFLTFLLHLANELAQWFRSFSHFSIILGKPVIFVFLLYCFCFLLVLIFLERKILNKRLVVLIITPFLLHLLTGKYSPQGEVTVLDVGQGDSIFIRLPFNQGNYLIDTGGAVPFNEEAWEVRKNPFDPGQYIIIPFLKSRGVDHLDKLIITHGDWDHLGSARSIVDTFSVKEVVVGKTVTKKETENELLIYLREQNLPIVEGYQGLKWEQGHYRFYILAPEKGAVSGNDASLVIYTELGEYRWLFTGDIEEEGEKKLLQAYPNLRADVLKVAHHGSRTSTTDFFLDKIRPEIAIISAGRNNRFGHPHAEVIANLSERHIQIYRTDRHGAVTYSFFLGKGRFTPYYVEEGNLFKE